LQLVAPAISQPGFPSTLPANTVVGRLGVGVGPSQAIPFTTLFGQPGLLHGPASSTVGHLATWNNTSGTELADYGAAFLSVPNGGTGAASFTAGRPLFGNGTSAFTLGTLSGNTTKLATTTGALATDNCVKIDANGNHVANGAACGSGGSGGGTLEYSAPSLTLTAGTRYAPPGGGGTPATTVTS